MKRFSYLFSLLFVVAVVGCGEEDTSARYAEDPAGQESGQSAGQDVDTSDPTKLADQGMGDYAKQQPGSEGTPVDKEN